MRVVTGHQPVYLPWLGLFHKASLADVFVYMDDVQYLVGDWNNRNLIKTAQGGKAWLTVPVDLKRSPSRRLDEIRVHHDQNGREWQRNHWRSMQMAYGKAPFFADYASFFEWLYTKNDWERLSDLNLRILRQAFDWFGIKVELVIASTQRFAGKKSDLVLEHGMRFGADVVVTGTLGRDYIDEASFAEKGMKVVFQNYIHPVYEQRFGAFVSHLSFVDLLFHHGPASREICLSGNITREDL